MEIKVFVDFIALKDDKIGEWFTLPMDEGKLKEELEKLFGDEEYQIYDSEEAPFRIDDDTNLIKLNEICQEINSLNNDIGEDEFDDNISDDKLAALGKVAETPQRLLEVLKAKSYYLIPQVANFRELALSNDLDNELLPIDWRVVCRENLEDYIDWDAVGNTMECNGWKIVRVDDYTFFGVLITI